MLAGCQKYPIPLAQRCVMRTLRIFLLFVCRMCVGRRYLFNRRMCNILAWAKDLGRSNTLCYVAQRAKIPPFINFLTPPFVLQHCVINYLCEGSNHRLYHPIVDLKIHYLFTNLPSRSTTYIRYTQWFPLVLPLFSSWWWHQVSVSKWRPLPR